MRAFGLGVTWLAWGAFALGTAVLAAEGAKPAAKAPRPPTALQHRLDPWTGDFDGMLERRIVRVLVPYSRTLFFNDRGAQRGVTADTLRNLELFLNRKFSTGSRPITVIRMPTTRDRLLSGLVEGRGDIAAGNIAITAKRDNLVDFSEPLAESIREIVVTGPASPKLRSLDDLAGREVHVRRSSSYHESLVDLNRLFHSQKRTPMILTLVPEALEDEDMMDMVGAGLLKLIVVDEWKADIWAGMLRRIRPRKDLVVTPGREIGWAFRDGSPQLQAVVNEFIRQHPTSRQLDLNRYRKYLRQLRNATAESDWKRFESTIVLFRKYGKRYRFDPLMLAAQGYQESRLDQNARSHKGAIGIMQVMPGTADSLGVGDITELEPNIHAGVRYLRRLHNRHLRDAELDEQNRTLFAFAAYNAGPTRVAGLRAEAEALGFDPNVWFDNVELVAARRIGQETVIYVRNIYKYYVAYKLQLETLQARRAAGGRLKARETKGPARDTETP